MEPHLKVVTNSDPFSFTTLSDSSVRMVTIPMCPDLLRYDQLGEADNLRGRVVRAFFWVMRIWPE